MEDLVVASESNARYHPEPNVECIQAMTIICRGACKTRNGRLGRKPSGVEMTCKPHGHAGLTSGENTAASRLANTLNCRHEHHFVKTYIRFGV
jgi:hypothetical protein